MGFPIFSGVRSAFAFLSRLALCFFLGSSLVFATEGSESVSEPTRVVMISQFVFHPALNETTRGIIDGLERGGFKRGEGVRIKVESAQADVALASQVANRFVAHKPDVVVGVGTVSAQSFVKYAKAGKVKLIFSSVTDPLGAGLISSLDAPGNNTSGVSNFVELEPQVRMFLELQPGLKKLGFLYNPGEANSVYIVKKLGAVCAELGITLVPQIVHKTSEVAQSAAKLAATADAIFISNDNTSLSAMPSVVLAANSNNIPVYVSDTDIVVVGATAALGPNQYDVGVQTGLMVADVLKGRDINQIPVEFPSKSELYVNGRALEFLGMELPSNVTPAEIVG